MAEEKKVLFSKSFRGYSRKDVNAYIIEENRRFSEKEERLRTENEKLCARVSELEGKLYSLNAAANEKEREYSASLADKDKEISRLMNELDTSRSHFEAECARFSEETKRLSDLGAEEKSHCEKEIESLKRELEACQAEHEKELESLKGDLEKSRIEHENELLSLKRNFERKEAEREEEFVSLAYRMKNKMALRLREFTRKCLREVMRGVGDIKKNADAYARESDERVRRINEGIDAYEEQMKDEVRKLLDDYKNSSDVFGADDE